jgi:hypothetical protein
MIKTLPNRLYKIIQSNKFFYVVIGLFVLQAAWFAVTAQYPMAFDENYHFGIIQIYSHQWLPFITSAPAHSAQYGDLTRYDSYLYHYLMSFPLRFIALFVHQQIGQIILLRFINIGLFVGGLFLFRRLLLRVHLTKALIHFIMLMLTLIPVVPFLAATINYDNLTFLLVPIVTGLTLACANMLIKEKRLPATSFILLFIVGGLAILVKYAFLPIFVAGVLYLVFLYIKIPKKKGVIQTLATSFKSLRRVVQILLVVGVIISGGLVAERYGYNLVRYHSIEPDCSKVQKLSDCLLYGPYGRNYALEQAVIQVNPVRDPPIALFIPAWLTGMVSRLYFAINYNYANYAPLPIPITMASIVGGIGIILAFIYRKYITGIDRNFVLFGLIIALYVISLFYVNFSEYLHYRTPTAINGRYLILIFPLLFAWIGLAYQRVFEAIFKAHSMRFLSIFAVVILFLALQGGGALTYAIRANPDWYFNTGPIENLNTTLKNDLSRLVIGSYWN